MCKEWIEDLPGDPASFPTVMLALFVEYPTPFFQEVLERIYKLNYPKSKLVLWVHNNVRLSLCWVTVYCVIDLKQWYCRLPIMKIWSVPGMSWSLQITSPAVSLAQGRLLVMPRLGLGLCELLKLNLLWC